MLVKNPIKIKLSKNDREIAFDGDVSLSSGNDFARNNVIFGVDNSSSSYTNNRKSNLLVI